MTLLDSCRRRGRCFGVVLLAAVGLVILTACGGNDDANDDIEQPIDVAETVAPAGPTSTPEPPPDPTTTPTTGPTSTPEPTATATSSPTPVPPTATPTVTPTPSPTPLPTRDNPFGEVISLADVLPNYTLNYTVQFDGTDDNAAVELFIAQARPELYHLRVVSAGQQTEAWRVDEVIYVLGPGGVVVELPGLVDPNLYAPSSFLFLVPDLSQIGVATILDEDAEVDGRPATMYEVDPASASAFLPPQSASTSDVDGVFHVWVDAQLTVITRMEADIEWSSGSTRQAMQMEFLITQIDSTPDMTPPGQ
jgi:hypothetical protein